MRHGLPPTLPRLLAALLLAGLVACNGTKDEPTDLDGGTDGGADGGTDGGADGGTDGGADGGTDGATELPPKPDPFTLQVTGGANLSLRFDTPTCQKPKGANNFRAFWRDSTGSHVFVLIVDLLGSYAGPGEYDADTHGLKVKLQEEAGGTGGFDYYATSTSQGDTATLNIEHLDEELGIAWGELSFDGLHPSSGAGVEVSPMPVPIWCDSLR